MQVKKQQLELDMEQQTGYKLRKGYVNAVYCYTAYLTYMQSTSCKIAGLDEAQAGIEIARRNINNLRYTDDTTLMGRKWRGTKEPLDECERGEWKRLLKTQHSENEDMASSPITSRQIDEEKVEIVTDFIFLGFKITAMLTAAMKLKDACSLEGKLWQT